MLNIVDPMHGSPAPRLRAAFRMPAPRILLCLLCCLPGPGCRSLTARGPVPEALQACRSLSQQGMAAMQAGDWHEAESLLADAIRACPKNVEARRQYAEALWQRGDHRAAVAQLEATLTLATDDPTLNVRAGEMYLALGELDRARANAERALYLNSSSGAAWALRGRVLVTRGEFEPALADFHRALSHAPDDRRLLFELAEAYRRAGRPERALMTLQRLADTFPPSEEPGHVLHLTALAFDALGRKEDARHCALQACRRGQPSAEMLALYARLEHERGNHRRALAALRQALAEHPQHQPALALLHRVQSAVPRATVAR